MSRYDEIVNLWQGYRIESEADLDVYLENYRILFAYNSAKIENADITYHDTREIFENGLVVGYTGLPRTLFEIQNMKVCYELLKPLIIARRQLSIELIREIHNVLTQGTYDEKRYIEMGERPGSFKKHDYVTGRHEVGSPPQQVQADLQELLDELQEYEAKDPLKIATYLHLRFEYIHPFADGNGRVGRALMNYYLMTHDHPPLIVYDEDKAAYYSALEAYDTDEDLESMHTFLTEQLLKTWDKTLQRSNIDNQ